MIVHYIVRHTSPHAARTSSYKLGKHPTEDHFDDADQARQFAQRCNECCTKPGIRYIVVPCEETDSLTDAINAQENHK